MFVRCERCRAVFELDDARLQKAEAVVCGRCDHAFTPRRLGSLAMIGTIGGAAAEAGEPVADEVTAPRVRLQKAPAEPPAPEKKRGRGGRFRGGALVVLFAAGLAAAGMAAIGMERLRPRMPAASPEALAQHRRGLEQLRRDDDKSLEQAVGSFGQAALAAPGHAEFRAMRVVATTLLSLGLRDRERDLADELELTERELERLPREGGPEQLAAVARLRSRLADLRAELGPVQLRGEVLLRDASMELAELAGGTNPEASGEIELAAAIFDVANHRFDDAERHLRRITGRADLLGFTYLVRGLQRVSGPQTPGRAAEAEAFLTAAVDADSALVRARVTLARLALTRDGADPGKAARLLAGIEAQNEAHPSLPMLHARLDRAPAAP